LSDPVTTAIEPDETLPETASAVPFGLPLVEGATSAAFFDPLDDGRTTSVAFFGALDDEEATLVTPFFDPLDDGRTTSVAFFGALDDEEVTLVTPFLPRPLSAITTTHSRTHARTTNRNRTVVFLSVIIRSRKQLN
jgi:hypothetical protein